MPNPYHDETGRFCSKEEMGAAVERLGTAVAIAGDDGSAGFKERYKQALDAYFELRRDYDAINSGVMEMPEEWVTSVVNSGLQGTPRTAEGLENFYRSGLEYNIRKPNDFHAPKAIDVLTNPATPQWIRDDMYRNASLEVKAAMIRHLSSGEDYPEIISEDLLPFTWGDNGHRNEVTRALLESPRLGFDVKYQLAKERGSLGYLVGLSQSINQEQELFERIPELEKDLKLEARSPLRPVGNRADATRMLARNTADRGLRTQLLAETRAVSADRSSTLAALAQNPNLSEEEGVILLERVAGQDSLSFNTFYERLATAQQTTAGNRNSLTVQLTARIKDFGTEGKGYAGVSSEREQDALAAVSAYDYLLDEGAHKHPTLPRDSQQLAINVLGEDKAVDYWQQLAVLDAQPKRYEVVAQDAKRLTKAADRSARQYNRAAHKKIHDELSGVQARIARARKFRIAQLVAAQVKAEFEREREAAA